MTALVGADKIIDYTGLHYESGPDGYAAWNADDGPPATSPNGIAFGLIQFNQKVGTLPQLLTLMHDADAAKYDSILGPFAANLLIEAYVRTGVDFNFPGLKARMLLCAAEPVFQQCQRQLAKSDYYDPAVAMATPYGLDSERSIAAVFDSCVQNGPPRTRSMLRDAAAMGGDKFEIRRNFATLADSRFITTNRRTQIINDSSLTDWPPEDAAPASLSAPVTQAPASAATSTSSAGSTATSDAAQARKSRLDALKQSVAQYVQSEQKRIDREVSILKKVLDGRTGGAGVQAISVEKVSAVAFNDLQGFLSGA